MKYRRFGRLEWESSVLGLNAAGLSLSEDAPGLGSTASIEMIRHAIDCGINYMDLGYPYDLRRQERLARAVGEALEDGYRKRIRIAVTLPSHLLNSTEDFDFHLCRQLDWLQADRADFCLFGRLNRDNWPVLQRLGAQNWAGKAVQDRRIDAVGFSFHDHYQALRHVLEGFEGWGFCQFQFSYMDIDHDPGIGGIKYAASKGLAVVATEPLRSGRLGKAPPDSAGKRLGDSSGQVSMAEWGMRFVWDYPEVATAIHAFRSIHEMMENAAFADRAESNSLTVEDELLINNVRDAYRKLERIHCSSCRTCMPCPVGIDVPRIFEIYNDAFTFDDAETSRFIYRNELHDAGGCNRCLDCWKRCPRKLDIVGLLGQALELFG